MQQKCSYNKLFIELKLKADGLFHYTRVSHDDYLELYILVAPSI